MKIRFLQRSDFNAWYSLWSAYCSFYKTTISEEVTQATWNRMLDPTNLSMGGIIAEEAGELLGFINYVIHSRTWDTRDTLYLEDLYVSEAARGKQVGYLLCDKIRQLALEKGLGQVYWNTQESNHTARRLYDRLATKDDFIRYVMPLKQD